MRPVNGGRGMKKAIIGFMVVAAVVAAWGYSVPTADAALFTNDFGPLLPGYVPNDDSVFPAVALPFSINFFGTTRNSIFVNNNGNATFGLATGVFTPSPLNTQSTQPMIAPYWTDLDSRSDPLGAIAPHTGGSGVYFRQTSPSEVVMTWDRLGYFPVNYSGRAQFQLVLRDPTSVIPAGEGVIGFFYDGMTAGTDNHNVTVGFGDGLPAINPGEISLFSGPTQTVAPLVNDQHFWFNLTGGIPAPAPPGPAVPEPGSIALLGTGLAALAFVRRTIKGRR
jgi:hypothetical protein